ncbi:MAG: sulfatase-like hydrolase/transferase, partial [Planctomycetota bacterium]
RPNVPKEYEAQARRDIAGYYAHIAALDDCIGTILKTLKETGLEDDTIVIFTSDHGDMLYSQGERKKQRPWDESILVPFLVRYPAVLGKEGRTIDMPINTPDIMPTLLALSGVDIPDTVEGADFSAIITGREKPIDNAALITCPSPFGQWYVRDLNGPWLLYDNQRDPYQLNNLCNKGQYCELQKKLEGLLSQKLKQTNDEFLPGSEYIRRWGYIVDSSGTVEYLN